MANKLYEESSVQAIADAIRAKNGTTTKYKIGEMGAAVNALPASDNITHADIPDYVKTAALKVADKVQAVRKADSIVFISGSDAHQLDSSTDVVTGNRHAGMAMKALAYIIPDIDFVCYLGDYTAGSATTTLSEGRQHFTEVNADIDEAFAGIPNFRTLGNHDSLQYSKAQNGGVLSAQELYSYVGSYNTGAVMGSTTEGYCYRDFDSKKVRVICLNTAEATEKEYVSDTQKLWFANTLKAAGAKTGWGIIILSHHPLDWGNVCTLSNIVKAYIDGSSITISSGNTVNFSGSNKATVLAAIHGHTHCFKAAKLNFISNNVGTEYNVWRAATPNMCFNRNNEYGGNSQPEYYGIEFGETTTYNKTANSANDTAFVVNVINPSEQKIYSFCYGAGYDRDIFTGITDIDLKATYGYADDTRLSTSTGAEKTVAGYVTIGHTTAIPIDKVTYPNGAVIRVEGADDVVGNSSPYTDSAWALYIGDGTTFSMSSYLKAGTDTPGTITVDADRKGFTLDIASLAAPRYLKFCVKGTGANLTATLTPK